MFLRNILGVILLFSAPALEADDAVLEISVKGFIKPPPAWVDASGSQIDQVQLNFEGYSDRVRKKHVNSNVSLIKLINAETDPADVFVARPRNCAIGQTPISDDDVVIRIDRKGYRTDQLISFSGRLRRLRLRFHRRGNYSAATGQVSCGENGRLTYAY